MDNNINQNNSQPVNNDPIKPRNNKKGISAFLKAFLLLIILILVAGGVYWWQHSRVNTLTSSKSSLNSEVSADNQKIASLNSKLETSKTSTTTTTSSSSACTNSQIKLTESVSPGAAGNEAEALIFTNDSTSSCTLYGYPLIQYLDISGNLVANMVEELTGGMIFPTVNPVSITLASNQQASVGLNWTEGGANQSTATTTEVYLPGSSTPLTISRAIGPSTANTGDSFDINVTAFQSGSSPKLTN